jgi:hypothetical protein
LIEVLSGGLSEIFLLGEKECHGRGCGLFDIGMRPDKITGFNNL